MTGDRKPEQIVRPLRNLVRNGIELVQAEVRRIDLNERRVDTNQVSLTYDYLVIASGSELDWQSVSGLESAHTFYTFEGASKLYKALSSFSGGRVAVVVSATPYKCPGAPHEGAMLLADFFKKRGFGEKVEVHLFTPEPQPMPVAGPALGKAVLEMLQAKRVAFHPLHKLTSIDPESGTVFFQGKEPFKCDLLVAIPPHRAPSAIRDAGISNEPGWVPVDPRTLRTRQENVYAIGDITTIPLPGRWKSDVSLMLPKAGVFAHAQALVVAQEIAAQITGTGSTKEFCAEGYCMLEAGQGLAGFAFGDFFGEPSPKIQLRRMGKVWHWGKIFFEQWWLSSFGVKRKLLETAMRIGAGIYGVPLEL